MALSDGENMVMPVAPVNNGSNAFGGDWAWIILLLLLGWGNNGNGFGGGRRHPRKTSRVLLQRVLRP